MFNETAAEITTTDAGTGVLVMFEIKVASDVDTGPCLTLSVMFDDVEAASKTHCFEHKEMADRDRLRTTLHPNPQPPTPKPQTSHP